MELQDDNARSSESDLATLGFAVFERLVSAIRESRSPQDAINNVDEAVYVKSTDGLIVLNNGPYDRYFGGSVSAVGRYAESFLDDSLQLVAEASDELILRGCEYLEFGHSGRSSSGDIVALRTYKRSLLGVGHPKMAILGVTRIEHVTQSNYAEKVQSLAAAWRAFQELDARDQLIANGIAQGRKIKALAHELNVSEKTIENRRNVIYRTLGVDGPTALVKILVRLQDNGFQDFGL